MQAEPSTSVNECFRLLSGKGGRTYSNAKILMIQIVLGDLTPEEP